MCIRDNPKEIVRSLISAMEHMGIEFLTGVEIGKDIPVNDLVEQYDLSLIHIYHYRETYECRACRKNGTPYMEKSPVPHPPVMHSLASASTIAWLVHQRCV